MTTEGRKVRSRKTKNYWILGIGYNSENGKLENERKSAWFLFLLNATIFIQCRI